MQVKPQLPVVQVLVAWAASAQALPQAPQLARSLAPLTSQPSAAAPLQSRKAPAQLPMAQAPLTQAAVAWGSAAQVQSLMQTGQLARVDAVVVMDMIGYSSDASLEALYESSASFSAYLMQFGAAALSYAPELAVVTSTNPFGSDHVSYLDQGVRTALAIENDWDIYPHYHSGSDLPANLGPHALAMGAAILKTNAAVIAGIAGLDNASLFANGFEAP